MSSFLSLTYFCTNTFTFVIFFPFIFTRGPGGGTRARSKVREGLDGYRATKVTLYKNGDPWFGSMQYRFLFGRDVKNLDGLFVKVNEKMDFVNGISHMFDVEGGRVTSIDQVRSSNIDNKNSTITTSSSSSRSNNNSSSNNDINNSTVYIALQLKLCTLSALLLFFQVENGGEYVMASSKKFTPANYGRTGGAFELDGGASRRNNLNKLKRISYNKKGGTSSAPTKPGSADGKVIKIVSAEDFSSSERVLLNMRTTQSFEEVVKDLGQVLKIRKANKLYTRRGKEIKSFSHLKLDFPYETTFFVSAGSARYFYMFL